MLAVFQWYCLSAQKADKQRILSRGERMEQGRKNGTGEKEWNKEWNREQNFFPTGT